MDTSVDVVGTVSTYPPITAHYIIVRESTQKTCVQVGIAPHCQHNVLNDTKADNVAKKWHNTWLYIVGL